MEQTFYEWIVDIKKRYKRSQIKAAVRVNSELIAFYFRLGKEITESDFKREYGSGFFNKLSQELKKTIPDAKGFSPQNLRYIESFYILYRKIFLQVVGKFENSNNILDINIDSLQVRQMIERISLLPWGHHQAILNKCNDNPHKAWFYLNKAIENNWSRDTLYNFLDTNLYERNKKAITNFAISLPNENSDLAKEIIKDPYKFNFITMEDDYTEKELKDALVKNIEKFLTELGTGFAYMGREYRLNVGNTEQFLDMLFYNTKVHAYVVIEVKTKSFRPEFIGQLGTYVVAVDHHLKTDRDEKTIGILICKDKDNVLARYSLESSTQPLGVSEYELSKLVPENFKGSLPTIEEIEEELKKK